MVKFCVFVFVRELLSESCGASLVWAFGAGGAVMIKWQLPIGFGEVGTTGDGSGAGVCFGVGDGVGVGCSILWPGSAWLVTSPVLTNR